MWDVEMLRLPAVALRLLRRSRVAAVYRTEESAPIGWLCPSRRLLFARGLLFVSALYRSFGRGGRVMYLRTRMYVCMYVLIAYLATPRACARKLEVGTVSRPFSARRVRGSKGQNSGTQGVATACLTGEENRTAGQKKSRFQAGGLRSQESAAQSLSGRRQGC